MPVTADHIANPKGEFEPQRQNNWAVQIHGLDGDDQNIIILSLSSGTIPGGENALGEVPYQNEKRFYAGQYAAKADMLTLRDYVDRETRLAIMRWRRKVYNPETGAIGLAKDYKKQGTLVLHGPDGTFERRAALFGCWPRTDPQGTLDMTSSDQVMVEFELVVDRIVWEGVA